MMKKSMAGFTLAEVLTTLMVIGVVAAMTIPTLMNSTNDQQLKVAYKKAMSVLSQGIQLMTAKETQCKVSNDASLAECFAANVLTGDRVYPDGGVTAGTHGGNQNVVRTNDGMAYSFFYAGDTTKEDEYRLIEEICGTSTVALSATNYAFGSGNNEAYNKATCYVVVDLNGLGKGAKYFKSASLANKAAISADQVNGSEQVPMIIYGEGVRPVYDANSTALSKGYTWMYGSGAKPYSGT